MLAQKNIMILKRMIKILFFGRTCSEEVWEYDYILNDIIPSDFNTSSFFLSLEEIRNNEYHFDIFVYSCRDPNVYEWGYMPSYDEVLECVLKTKPKIIIQLSDEYVHENLEQHNSLSEHCELMLRQYNHSEYRNQYFGTGIPSYDNLIHIPLGYLNGFKIERKNILPISERDYNWSFVGNIKDYQFYYYDYSSSRWLPTSDREKMITLFSENIDNYFFRQSGISKKRMVKIYNNSLFVPCGRGNVSLNCFRNYESTICGAIPVVVSKFPEEFDISFKYYEKPPWIFSECWESAIEQCISLLNFPDKIQDLQNANLLWWDTLLTKIKGRVRHALYKED